MNNNSSIPSWLLQDNKERIGKYKRDINNEEFMYSLNNVLNKFEEDFESSKQDRQKPIIFFFGMPRNGKTVFSQLLTSSLDLGYPNNLIAKFFKAPSVGIRLTKILDEQIGRTSSFSSDYGKTANLSDPHDFAYFWQDLFNIDSLIYDYIENEKKIDWSYVQRKLNIFVNAWDKPALFKGIYPSYHIQKIADMYPNVLFIYLQRNFVDSAISLLKGRVSNYGDKNKWYGQTPRPHEYEELLKLPYNEQIGGQFFYIDKMIEDSFKKIDSKKFMHIKYQDICSNPLEAVLSIKNRIKELYDYDIKLLNEPYPDDFKYSTYDEQTQYYKELEKGLLKFGLKARIE